MPKSYFAAARRSGLRCPSRDQRIVQSVCSATDAPACAPIERLEGRTLLSVSLDANGWTVIAPPAGAHVIYCSSSSGNDANDGLSPAAPVQTLDRGISLLRDNSGDQLLLQRGDVWHSDLGVWRKSGKSADQPLVVGAYGTGARPELMTGDQDGLDAIASSNPEIDNVAITGIHFYSDGRDPNAPTYVGTKDATGINFLTKTSNLLIEDCQLEGYTENVNIQGFYGPIQNVQFRRNVIDDAYSVNEHSQGLYCYGVTNLLVEGNVFDHNGFNDQIPGAEATWYNHDCYISGDNDNCTVRDNIFAEASGYGLQARAGGIIEDNVFVNNPVGMTYGLVNGAHVYPGGVTGVVNGNVFTGGANIDTIQGGSGLQIGNTKPGYPTVISNNIFTRGVANAPAAITLSFGMGDSNPQDAAGLNDVMIEQNIVDNWNRGVYVDSGFQPGGAGAQALNNVQVRQNDFQHVPGLVIQQSDPIDKAQEKWANNTYSTDSTAVQMNQRNITLSQWRASDETGAQVTDTNYSNPAATIEAYNAGVGGMATAADFLAQARLQSSQTWRAAYDAESIIAYFRQAFQQTGAPARDWRAPTPPIAAAALPTSVEDRDTSLTFNVTYTDLKALDLSTIGNGNVNVTGKKGLNAPATLVNMTGSGASATATYSIAVPDTYFRKGTPQKLTVVMNGAQVTNSDGFSATAGPIGTFRLRVLPRPKPPTVKNVRLIQAGKAIAVHFSTDVSIALRAADLSLQSDAGQTIDPSAMSMTWNAKTDTAAWTFPGEPGATLQAGKWTVRLNATDIVDTGGRHLDGNKDGVGGDDYVSAKPIVVKASKR